MYVASRQQWHCIYEGALWKDGAWHKLGDLVTIMPIQDSVRFNFN